MRDLVKMADVEIDARQAQLDELVDRLSRLEVEIVSLGEIVRGMGDA